MDRVTWRVETNTGVLRNEIVVCAGCLQATDTLRSKDDTDNRCERCKQTGEKYQGYANRETFLAALWIDNDQGAQGYWQDQAKRVLFINTNDRDGAIMDLAGMLQEDHGFIAERADLSGVLADLLDASLERVDWRDLAEHLLAE